MTRGKGSNPGVGNLGKHIKRTTHKERSQPASRKHLGQLEKHKDHAVRSRRRKAKMQRLLQLKRAAAQRNPDEFHIGMTKAVLDIASGKMKQRTVLEKGNRQKTQKVLQQNTRNIQYLQYKAQSDLHRAKELLKEDASIAITSAPPQNKHIVFVESDEEFRRFNPVKYFDATPEMLKQHPAVRGTISILQNTVLPEEVLLTGPRMLSSSQRRRERREMQEKLRKSGAKTTEEREAVVERLRAKKELKKYRFSSLVEEAAASSAAADGRNDGNSHSAAACDSEPRDDVEHVLQLRRAKEEQEAALAARNRKEIQQRVERGKSLSALAKTIKRQNESLRKNLQQKRESQFKPTAARRSR
ncbi:U3 snoRNA-associated protein UTP11 [Trypanosoma rangeli]|uniref:U3 snoRNA-associated protein UTP11 n=1 Tax=Trypanosoma rangeli TaxID=5698 RepID=A0A3R7NS36_TRYRA|nr:U3 snoRNA-associated protein UTP11 [Trypanosoma rangeli]RNF06823.1 U3 snoRNA-associated protein UTP11 [Trypanosoma rangeli]|eukprot:RNF06823.1 U3 snoRNA-associated protein UTP11 [Trypanosoma rangeli]